MKYKNMTFNLFLSVTYSTINRAVKKHAAHISPTMMKPTTVDGIIICSQSVSQSSGRESLMQSSKPQIDSSWPSHQLLHCHYLCITKASLPTSSPRHTRQAVDKHNHGPMQKVTREVQLWPVWPSLYPLLKYQTQSQDSKYTAHKTSRTQQWSRETCRFLNIKEHGGHRLGKWAEPVFRLVCGWSAYFLVAPCLCADSRTDSDGGGRGP